MTTIKQAMVKTIKNYLEDGGYYNYNGSKRLYADTQNCFGIPNSIQLQIVAICAKEICPKPSIHPDALISEILNPMGLITGDELVAWLGGDYSMFKSQGYADILNPPVPDLGKLQTVPVNVLRNNIRRVTGIHPLDLETLRDSYRLVPKDRMQDLVTADPSRFSLYEAPQTVCIDFAEMSVGWYSKWNYGDLSVGYAKVTLIHPSMTDRVHALLFILNDKNEAWIYDSQSAYMLWPYGNVPPISNCNEIVFNEIRI